MIRLGQKRLVMLCDSHYIEIPTAGTDLFKIVPYILDSTHLWSVWFTENSFVVTHQFVSVTLTAAEPYCGSPRGLSRWLHTFTLGLKMCAVPRVLQCLCSCNDNILMENIFLDCWFVGLGMWLPVSFTVVYILYTVCKITTYYCLFF